MPVHDPPIAVGTRRSRQLRARLSAELSAARRGSGLSVREVARRMGTGRDRVAAVERGDAAMTIESLAAFAAVVGLELSATLHPAGPPVRDKGHLALIERFRARLAPTLRLETEVPIPLPGDRRSVDGVLRGPGLHAASEFETHLGDIQALEREVSAKQRDLGAGRAILVVARTRHNLLVLGSAPELHRRFPIGTRSALAALRAGRDPGGDSLIVI